MGSDKIVFIDRDGVINVDLIGDYIKSWEEFRFEPSAIPSLQSICKKGFNIIIISNQAGVGDGVYSESSLWKIHEKMISELNEKDIKIKATYYCLHGKNEGCSCRKPEIGLFDQAVKGLKFDPKKTFFIGDKATDVEAGKRFGLKTIFVRTGHGKADEKKLPGDLKPDFIVDDLEAAVPLLDI